jgi:hypothetical protein
VATADPGANDTAQYHGADPRWQAIPPLLIGGALLLWPSAWNGYPIVFADTGTYLSQAIHRYLGWDRPIFYSLFIFPLHATVSTWPVPIAQALIDAWLLHLTRRVIAPHWSRWSDPAIAAALAIGTWLPFLASTLMPAFYPLAGAGAVPAGLCPGAVGWLGTLGPGRPRDVHDRCPAVERHPLRRAGRLCRRAAPRRPAP